MQNKQHTIIILILGLLIALSPFSIDMYLPAFPAIASSLKTDIAHVGYSLTSYYAGLCAGQLIYGILIDRFGRKRPLYAGLLIYLIATLACAFSVNINMLVSVRLFMALGGCVGMVAARAIVRDLFPPKDTARVLSLLVLVMGIAPIIAPAIGGIVNTIAGWRWVFGVMALIALALLIATYKLLPETKTPDPRVSLRIKDVLPEYISVLKKPTFLVYTLAGGISYAGLYAYIAGSPFVFMTRFGFSDTAYSWAFAFNACGLISGSQINRVLLNRYDSTHISFYAAIMLFITGLLLLISTTMGIAGAPMTLCFTFLFLFCLGFLNPNTTALALRPFTAAAGRASAVLGSIQMIAGVIASWTVNFFFNGTANVMATVMFGCTALTLLLLVFFTNRLQIKQDLQPA
ncbi:MFS transporter, DHA1 family, bicyclomycin/chloramphenicol resistance protein [Chitinophaga sp. YR627]|uniref:multidrug effflux MFS transporter n=1 Tax=Chitinophaga sp. YR627 TaxID=1881041 RepID=UPI0008EE0FEE|nr:multidrug effflux MFS transporter [Chitinophaga sp. YR627]SFM58595.1 MFS transporter, DHA1 family, bicyclomycin/chloramphenicol resistance protein [Chitinophaga sp. YR627]